MRALITGGNGFLGTWLTQALCARKDTVRLLLRPNSDRWGLKDLPIEIADGDVTDRASVERACAGMDVVFHLAGIRRAPSRALFDAVNAEGTRIVCDAMVKAGARRLVLCSSLSAMGPSTLGRPHVEEDPFNPFEPYGESKAEAERIAFSYRDRLEVTAIRPPRVMGPGDKENLVFFKIVRKNLKLVVGGGPRPLSLVDADDVVALMLQLAERAEAVGESFFVTADGVMTIEEVQTLAAEVLQVTPRTLYVPTPVLRSLAVAADAISNLTGKNLPLNRKLARQLLAPAWTCSAQKAKRLLGWSPRWALPDSVRRSAAWYRENQWL